MLFLPTVTLVCQKVRQNDTPCDHPNRVCRHLGPTDFPVNEQTRHLSMSSQLLQLPYTESAVIHRQPL